MPPPTEVHTDSDSDLGDEGVVEMEDDARSGEEGHGRAGAVAAAEGANAEGRPPACCPVCMDPWTCNGAHRICCIPCGHVYGRSCLERWLQHCGNTSSKCPQCGERFELKHITNLYAPGNLWDGCCRIELFDAHLAETKAQIAVECQMMIDKLRSELDESFRSRASALLSDVQQVCQKQVDHDVGAMVKAFVSMKEQMKKMAEQNATPMDLIEFMEQSYTQLQIPSRPPAEGDGEIRSA